jgi:hypothetical protein
VDERDKDLTGLFVRDLDQIALPPRGDWRRARGRENTAMRASRYLLTAGAVVAVLAVALIIGFQLRDRSQSAAPPSASPTPSSRGAAVVDPSASPKPTATPPPASGSPATGGAVYNDEFGLIVQDYNGGNASLRKESSNARIVSFTPVNPQSYAVSPDGRNVAYFAPGTGGGPQQLRTFPAGGNATEQTLATLPAGVRGGAIVWSSDGAGLLYSTETGGSGIVPGPNSATLNIYELAADGRHATTIDAQSNTGLVYRPIAWDRSANVAAAGITGEGGYMVRYVTVRSGPGSSFTVSRADMTGGSIGMGSVHASTDAKLVFGVIIGLGPPSIAYWPLADISSRKTTSADLNSALWQPGTHKIAYLRADGAFILFQTDDGSSTTVFAGPNSYLRIAAFRPDGSAVLLAAREAPTSNSTDFTLYRLSDGASVTFQELVGVMVSVRLR